MKKMYISRWLAICLSIVISLAPLELSFSRSLETTYSTGILGVSIDKCKVDAASSRYGRSKLSNKAQRYIYDSMLKIVKSKKKTLKFDTKNYNVTYSNFSVAKEAFIRDYPEYCYYGGGGYTYSYGKGNSRILEKATFKYDSSIVSNYSKFEEAVDKIIDSIPEECDTKYLKALYLHDYLCELVTYGEGDHQQNAYGALVDNVCVCEGYARAYKVLLQKVGIKSWVLRGETTVMSADGHSWNLVILDDKCYYVDTCWDDNNGDTVYTYFMRSFEEMEEDHWLGVDEDTPALEKYIAKSVPTECNHDDKDVVSMGIMGRIVDELTVSNVAEAFGDEYIDKYGRTAKKAVLKVVGDVDMEKWTKENCRSLARAIGISDSVTVWRSCTTKCGITTISLAA